MLLRYHEGYLRQEPNAEEVIASRKAKNALYQPEVAESATETVAETKPSTEETAEDEQ